MPCSLPVFLFFSFSLSRFGFALPESSTPLPQSIPLHRRALPPRNTDEWGAWAKAQRAWLEAKYADESQPHKRASGTNLLTNQNADSSFFGSLAIGTPPVSYNVILDTGSSDLFVADVKCVIGCNGTPTFDPSKSSSFSTNNDAFHIKFGSGQAAGTLGQDIVEMAGFSVHNQTFAICDRISPGLLSSPVSGLLGLAWQAIASSGAAPFWQALVAGGVWDFPVMSFQLTRFVDDRSARPLEPGGTFTMGFVNTSLFTGDIEYLDINGKPSYWVLPMTAIHVQGNSISLPAGSASLAAIDTGTTLVGGPSEAIANIYVQIPGAQPATGNFDGYYTYPCSTSVNVTLAFGGRDWPISPADFRLTQLSPNTCLGAFFVLSGGSSAPAWIVGDTFLKNVYSVFRYNPPSIGFAELSTIATAMNDSPAPIPSPTIGSPASVITVHGPPSNTASPRMHLSRALFIAVTLISLIIGLSL
ncbi:acid protease [Tricholoma matsutake]|nr:acid protease [Tricholoma matsutake 945]